MEGTNEELDEQLVRAWIGKGNEKIYNKVMKGGFHIGSFLFPGAFYFARKMYMWGIIFFILDFIFIQIINFAPLTIIYRLLASCLFYSMYKGWIKNKITQNSNTSYEDQISIAQKKGGEVKTFILVILILVSLCISGAVKVKPITFNYSVNPELIGENITQENQDLSNSNDEILDKTSEINDSSNIIQENEDIESNNESNTIKIESSYNPESNISGEYITDFVSELAYSVPSNYVASEYNDNSLKMYSDEEYYNSAHFITTPTSLYSSVDEYITSSIIYEGMEGEINFAVAEINNKEWTIVEVLKEYGAEYHYVTIHNNTIYELDYTISDVPDTKDYNELVMIQNSLVFQ